MKFEDISTLDWQKGDGLLPAVVQHADTGAVLMLGFMNREALRETLERGRVFFYSRSRKAQWMKGETSGNVLNVVSVSADCDKDTLLILAEPSGPVCHRGTATCFVDQPPTAVESLAFLARLESVIAQRIAEKPQGSYTARLFAEGPSRIAQKIGEEGVEVALAAIGTDDEKIVNETADLMYHLLLLMKSRNLSLDRVVRELESRHAGRS
ncbi:MAG TPA: bifunctional phosphoribosyl-AMP cyclohydrolase/phosphoribosyl-ATP diphosphatase HisIE [Steroidobacteraceae bacterium]|jgi:phosphoribosyl-ATP pyrophosphohydrolase/phosphoribosyl-AMP cyclohydrolase|nr:bifunctional phosphoribosyl-AMP cyclohydrolase/phosphoribosyl-ATP diphosphatase HisIE [Steroidobacteraceae bacterium]